MTAAKERYEAAAWIIAFVAMALAWIVKEGWNPVELQWLDNALFWVGAACAFLAFLWMPFARYEEMTKRLSPRLKIVCDGSPGCRPPVGGYNYNAITTDGKIFNRTEPAQFFRLALLSEAEGGIKNVTTWFTRIEKAGEASPRWDGEKEKLTFVPGDRPDAETGHVPDEIPTLVDVIVITKSGLLSIANLHREWRYPAPLREIFRDHGDYVFHVSASADGTKSVHARLQFVWTGKMETSALSKLP